MLRGISKCLSMGEGHPWHQSHLPDPPAWEMGSTTAVSTAPGKKKNITFVLLNALDSSRSHAPQLVLSPWPRVCLQFLDRKCLHERCAVYPALAAVSWRSLAEMFLLLFSSTEGVQDE